MKLMLVFQSDFISNRIYRHYIAAAAISKSEEEEEGSNIEVIFLFERISEKKNSRISVFYLKFERFHLVERKTLPVHRHR